MRAPEAPADQPLLGYHLQDLEEVQELLEAVVVSTQCMLDEVPCEVGAGLRGTHLL